MKCLMPLFFVFSLSFGQNSKFSSNVSFEKNFKKDSAIKDFSTLYYLLNTIHPGQYMHCEKLAFDKCYDSLINSIQTDLSVQEYYCKASFLISKIKDGHTWADNSTIKSQLQNKLVFPFSIYKIADKYFVKKSGSKKYNAFIGKPILKINDENIQEIISKIRPYMSLEGENETSMNYTFQLFPFYYFLIDSSNTFKIDYSDSIGITQSAVLNGIAYKEYIKNTGYTFKIT